MSIDSTVPAYGLIDLRDRVLTGTLTFSWVRISAALGMRVRDFDGTKIRVHEKGGLHRRLPATALLQELLNCYINATDLREFPDSPLFRSTSGTWLMPEALSSNAAWKMVKRRCRVADLPDDIYPHHFRGTGITEFMNNGDALHEAQMMTGHANPSTIQCYDHSRKWISQNMFERVHIEI